MPEQPVYTSLSPTQALRAVRGVLSDRSLTKAERIATAAVILSVTNATGKARISHDTIRRIYGVSLDSIASALRPDPSTRRKGKTVPDARQPKPVGKSIGRHLAVVRRGPAGSHVYSVLQPAEDCDQVEIGASTPFSPFQRSGHRNHSSVVSGDTGRPGLDTEENAKRFSRQIGEALQLSAADVPKQQTAIRAVFRRACDAPEPCRVLLALVKAAAEIGDSSGEIRKPAAAWQARANAILGGRK